ncbi:tRNA (N6-threonylcarbamoyladenosine(37)-N6)-methyltransferase TrmO [Psychrosphaera sp. B3R10]|uniref:tRNA (N6-threonylcarbamoyladenosine(37)-N6)-methyltransferase TrmO n=1 Tax=unclassified Psychrosphaera TaxID=2641570 RepID=UPI001C0A1753|nr:MULTISPECIES: tRNA (N6-threonylcarbamoyladenosine(37)-N6)-methyltransferase TrmO [unclassified Psychrosphaera]MBU2881137.1 tRNA (N6-threonylcarbamoyladenosine(37)-N6)-methyltransferase TrmO [Psychrosphaera sp. I2R16]MBU2988242.1 tRNA (N6-threonylcarbamoyladenosine(37)-N6)-methyltransferase TrmO [Psychrosphaera sp. B3R10]
MNTLTPFTVNPIGFVASPFKEKFGIPRQPKLCQVSSLLWLHGDANNIDCIRDIELNSHIWVLFQFHQNSQQGWHPLVRPPRLDGNKKTGVFATRSTFRPNQIGMSAVKLLDVGVTDKKVWLEVEGLDLLDGTPIVDIKPYIPYADAIPEATSEFAPSAQETQLNIRFSNAAHIVIEELKTLIPNLKIVIEQVLKQDPRPAYKKGKPDDKIYGIRLYDLNIRWSIDADECHVLTIEHVL